MNRERFVRCCQCNHVHVFTDYDDLPEYEYDEKKSEYKVKSRDDGKAFLMMHAGHDMEELRVMGEQFVDGDSYLDPNLVVYYNMTNGTDYFILKKNRTANDMPVQYQISPGLFRIVPKKLKFNFERILDLVSHHEWGNCFLSDNRKHMVDALKYTLSTITPDSIDLSETTALNPRTEICGFSSAAFRMLIETMSEKLGAPLPEDAIAYLEEQNFQGGALNIVVEHEMKRMPGGRVAALVEQQT